MSRPRFPRALLPSGCVALLVVSESSQDPDLAPFAGAGRLGDCFVVAVPGKVPRLGFFSAMERGEAATSGLPTLDEKALGLSAPAGRAASPVDRWRRAIESGLAALGVKGGRIALSGRLPGGLLLSVCSRLRRHGWSFEDGRGAVLRLRRRKTGAELAEIREVAACAGAAFSRTAQILRSSASRRGELWWQGSRLTVGTVRGRIASCLAEQDLTMPEGSLLAPAEEGAVPHNTGTDRRVLRAGESIVVDLFPRRRLFSDCTRTFCVGRAPSRLREAHSEVLDALQLARKSAAVGVRGFELQERVCELFQSRGRATPLDAPGSLSGYVHGLGHGVGYEVHEYPHFRDSAGAEGVLEDGDVITLEPGLYSPEEGWAVRLEDLFVLTKNGPELLTDLPYDLDPRAWPET